MLHSPAFPDSSVFRFQSFALLIATISLGIDLALVESANAQVVQQPVLSNFSTTGGFSVPDSGGAYMGGTGYGSWNTRRSSSQPYQGQLRRFAQGASGASITAQVIDLQALDAAILGEASASRGSATSRYSRPADGDPIVSTIRTSDMGKSDKTILAKPPSRDPFGMPFSSPNIESPDYAGGSGAVHDESEIRFFLDRAQHAQSLGRYASAQVYYRMAEERMSPAQRAALAAKIKERLEQAEAARKPASTKPSEPTTNVPVNAVPTPDPNAATDPFMTGN